MFWNGAELKLPRKLNAANGFRIRKPVIMRRSDGNPLFCIQTAPDSRNRLISIPITGEYLNCICGALLIRRPLRANERNNQLIYSELSVPE